MNKMCNRPRTYTKFQVKAMENETPIPQSHGRTQEQGVN